LSSNDASERGVHKAREDCTIANVRHRGKRTELAIRSAGELSRIDRCLLPNSFSQSSYNPRIVILATILGLFLPFVFGEDVSLKPYETAASVRALTDEQAALEHPVLVHGVVTCSTDFGIFIQDKTGGIWVRWKHPRDFATGEEIEVKGHTDAGEFSAAVQAETIRKLGHAPMPRPASVTFEQLLTGDEEAQYVTITGLVLSVEIRPNVPDSQNVWLKVAVNGGIVLATLPAKDATRAGQLIDATVRIDAPATCAKNQNRQITSVVLPMPSIHNLTVIRPPPEDLFAAPLFPIGGLMRYRSGTDSDHRVRVAGTVTYFQPGESLILQEGERAILVKTVQRSDIKVGDRIEAIGFPIPTPSGPFLQDAIFRYTGSGRLPDPVHVTAADLASGSLNNILVSIDAKLLNRIEEPAGPILLLLDGSTLVRAELDGPNYRNTLGRIQEGSIVRVEGISVLDVEGLWNYGGPTASTIHYKLLLRSPGDVEEIQPPSWWTATHLFYLIGVLGVLMFTFFALALYGRMDHWRLEAVLHERERLALEIHDTLAQSFAGIGFQMQAIRRKIPDEMPELRQQVDLARALVRHSHIEARRSIQPIHLELPQNADLMSALQTSARRMVDGGSVEVSARVAGHPHPLPGKIMDALLHIGQEAVANAVRHADPSHLNLVLTYHDDSVQLGITDDGCGFEESGDLLGFGLRGMRSRAAAISAKFEIVSNPGRGTQVKVTCPLPPSHSLNSLFQRIMKFNSRNGSPN
jgi:hypothetical protein